MVSTGARAPAQNVLPRAVLTSTAIVVAAFPGAVVVGGYLPDLPTIGRFGVYLTTDLPAVVLIILAALALALAALSMGGGRFTKLLVGAIGVVLAGSLLAGGRLWLVANDNGAAYSPFRQLGVPPDSRAPDQRLVFASGDGTELHADVWSHFRAAGSTGSAPGPALVFIHGGAFVAGELGSRAWLFQSLADAGYPVIDIEYRLAPRPRWHDAPADVLCALAWVHGQAEVLGIDPARVVAMGDSAGASLALVAGYAAGTNRIAPSCPGRPVIPAGVIAIEPAADLEGIWQDGTISDGQTTFPQGVRRRAAGRLPRALRRGLTVRSDPSRPPADAHRYRGQRPSCAGRSRHVDRRCASGCRHPHDLHRDPIRGPRTRRLTDQRGVAAPGGLGAHVHRVAEVRRRICSRSPARVLDRQVIPGEFERWPPPNAIAGSRNASPVPLPAPKGSYRLPP